MVFWRCEAKGLEACWLDFGAAAEAAQQEQQVQPVQQVQQV